MTLQEDDKAHGKVKIDFGQPWVRTGKFKSDDGQRNNIREGVAELVFS